MPLDLHFVCKHGVNHTRIKDQVYETGNWAVSESLAKEAIGGRIYLHETQNSNAWHGGTIIDWRFCENENRIIFTFEVDGPFRIKCLTNWAQEKAIIRR